MKFAVVGAGPSGLYVADELVERVGLHVQVDIFDRLPTPYGLVRYGVAPDHPNIKSVASTLEAILQREQVRFFGNVEFGVDVMREDLLRCYDVVIYATGAPGARRLGLDEQSLPGCYAAGEFVGWYNGHPESAIAPSLQTQSAVVVGAGNVALDIARVLARNPEDLLATDIPHPVLECLRGSLVSDIHVVIRSGPAGVKFSAKELRELGKLEDVELVADPDAGFDEDLDSAELSRQAQANIKIFREWAGRVPTASRRRVHFHFRSTVSSLDGTEELTGVRISGPGDALQEVRTGLLVTAVGYRGSPIADVPFDDSVAVIPNIDGRVTGDDGTLSDREFVVGWIKRGPSGVIGTNKQDAAATVECIAQELDRIKDASESGPRAGILELLRLSDIKWVDLEGWQLIDRAEVAVGEKVGRTRIKITSWPDLVEIGATRKAEQGQGA